MLDSLYANIPYTFNLLSVQSLVVSLAFVALGTRHMIREQASPVSVVFFILSASIGLWLFGYSWMYGAVDIYLATWWAKVGFIGVICIPAAVYHFVSLVLGDYAQVRKSVLFVWITAALFITLHLAVNFIFEGLYLFTWGYYPRLGASSIPFLVYFCGLMLVALRSSLLIVRRSTNSSTVQRARILVTLFLLALVAGLDFLPAFGVTWYPFGYLAVLACLVIAALSIKQYRFKVITPAFAAQEILQTMNEALFVLDADGIVRLVNQATCNLFGYRAEDLVGKEPREGMVHCEAFAEKLHSLVEAGAIRQAEVECVDRSGARRTLSLSTSAMQNEGGGRIATVCMVSDTTARKRTEEDREKLITELQDAYHKLQTMDRMKSEFVSIVSHELRTPLTTIKAFIELIMMKPEMDHEKRLSFLGKVNVETDRLKRLISDLLDLARIESGSMNWRTERISLEGVASAALAAIKPLYEDKELSLTAAFDSHLPAVCGDSDRLIQVVTNILSNALKFTPAGGRVRLVMRASNGNVLVRVEDTGMGIAAGDLELIFEKFRRSGDPLTNTIDGTGLGLAIARQIVEHHGGRIWAESAPGKGSAFSFTLPACD